MATYFPQELFPQILVRLPVKSLLRFRCVSKSWNSLITGPDFIAAHIHHNTTTNCNALVRCYYSETRDDAYTLHLDNKNLDMIAEVELPFKNTYEFFYILDCANGVLCLLDSYQRTNTIVLWNPIIRRALILPNPNYELTTQHLMQTALGFGFDSLNNDYKFVRIYILNGFPAMDIFRLSTCSWSNDHSFGFVPTVRANNATYLNGVLHWLALDHKFIAGFDLGTETFREFLLPRDLESKSIASYDISIVVWQEQLSIFEIQSRGTVCLWLMKEYGVENSWIKQYEIENYGPLGGIRRNGELIFHDHSNTNGNVLVYEPEAREIKRCNLQFEGRLNGLQIFPYVESLVLLKEGQGLTAEVVREMESIMVYRKD